MKEKIEKLEKQRERIKDFIKSEEWTEEVKKQLEIALHEAEEELSQAKIEAGDEAEIRFSRTIEENAD